MTSRLEEKGSPELGKNREKTGWPEQGRLHLEKPQRDQAGLAPAGSPEPAWVWDIPSVPAQLNACSNALHPSLAWEAIALQLQAANLIPFSHRSPALTLAPSQINQLFYSCCGGSGGRRRSKPKHLSINCIFNIKQGDGPESALSPSYFFLKKKKVGLK